jgi:hypothetical protein
MVRRTWSKQVRTSMGLDAASSIYLQYIHIHGNCTRPYHSVGFGPFFLVGTATTFCPFLAYPIPSSQGQTVVRLVSKASIASLCSRVNPISSRPLIRQCRLNGSIENLTGGWPFGRTTSCFSRSTASSRPAAASL